MYPRIAARHVRPICRRAASIKHRSRNKWRKLPACDGTISRKLEAYATEKSDSYFSNGANATHVTLRSQAQAV